MTECISHDIGFAWGVRNSYVIIFYQLNPASLPEIKIWLGENIFEALVVGIDLTTITKEVMTPSCQGMNYGSEFKVMGRIVLFMWTQLPRSICYHMSILHKYAS